jgi:6-phosphofructokinase 1
MSLRIGVLTGGGDCPGLNPAIKGLVLGMHLGAGRNVEVLGLRDGWKSLVQEDLVSAGPASGVFFGKDQWWKVLTPEMVELWDAEGGTNLGSSRTNPFKKGAEREEAVIRNIQGMKLDVLVAIGGEDTLGVALKLHRKGIPVVGVPKTIDKDLPGTEYTLGFETAVQIITQEVDRVRTTAGSHSRTFVIETMGRHAGHLALQGGIAAGAYVILIPEWKYNVARVVKLLSDRRTQGARYSIVVISEGAMADSMKEPFSSGSMRDTGFEHVALGGIGELLRAQVEQATDWDLRSVNLSHLQRGGAPCAFDRRMGRLFGAAAADLCRKRDFGKFVAVRDGKVTAVPLTEIDGPLLTVDVEKEYDRTRYNARRSSIL